jgi:hypothetical protein
MNAIETSELPALHSFVRGLRREFTAVMAGLSLPYSNGPIEGRQHQDQAVEAADVWTGRLRRAPQTDSAQLTTGTTSSVPEPAPPHLCPSISDGMGRVGGRQVCGHPV